MTRKQTDQDRGQVAALRDRVIRWTQTYNAQDQKMWCATAGNYPLPCMIRVHAVPTQDMDGSRVYYAHVGSACLGPYVKVSNAKRDGIAHAYKYI